MEPLDSPLIRKAFLMAIIKLETPSNEQLPEELATLQTRLQNILQETDTNKIDEFARSEKLLSQTYEFAYDYLLEQDGTRNKEGLPPEVNSSSSPLNLENDIEVIETIDTVGDKEIKILLETLNNLREPQGLIKTLKNTLIKMLTGQ